MAEKEVLKLRKLPSQERSRKTMTTIYETAARIFAEVGFAETTTDQIAAEAGISIGTLYNYFSAKEAILHGLWEQHQQEIMRVAQKVDKNIREQGYVDESIIPMLLRIVLDLVSADKIQNRLFISQGGLPESIIQKRRELGMYLESVMENVFHDFANVRIKNAKVGVHIIWATVQAVIHDYIFPLRLKSSRKN